jgi:hypothetical protein
MKFIKDKIKITQPGTMIVTKDSDSRNKYLVYHVTDSNRVKMSGHVSYSEGKKTWYWKQESDIYMFPEDMVQVTNFMDSLESPDDKK